MTTPREGPNPLRPYYIPPSVGHPGDVHHNVSSAPNISKTHASVSAPTTSFGSSARNILADMDYSEYLSESSPSPKDVVKQLVEQALWRYSSVFLAQPFEVAKTVLQVHAAPSGQMSISKAAFNEDMRRRPASYRRDSYDVSSDDSDPDSPSYFTSTAPSLNTQSQSTRSSRPRRRCNSPDFHSQPGPQVHTPQSPPRNPRPSPHILDLKSSTSLLTVLSNLWSAEGTWGIWKGTNSTYVHSILSSTITTFTRSFISALLALPDAGFTFPTSPSYTYAGGLDILSSPSPLTSLAVAISAAGVTGILLAPLDIARTQLILTPSTHPPRSILSTLQSLSSWTLPWAIAPVTLLHSTLPTFLSASFPLFLRSKLGIDPLLTPSLYAIATFIGQTLELGIKLPIETVLRRGQLAVSRAPHIQTIVEVGPYKGLVGTMLHIVYEEGERGGRTDMVKGTGGAPALRVESVGKGAQRRKGQGVEGLFRGWRVGMWGLVGVWGAATLGGIGGKGGEF